MKHLELTSNQLKLIAALSMLADHTGFLLFPDVILFRIVGRLAFPIFAFMLAEGCRYTKNKLRYFSVIAVLAIVCQIFYALFSEPLYLNIFFTLAFAILIIYAAEFLLSSIVQKKVGKSILAVLVLLLVISTVYIISAHFRVDYGFWGCMLPFFAAVYPAKKGCLSDRFIRIGIFALGMIPVLSGDLTVQYYSAFALILLLMYNGERGTRKMKYFFYLFYPLHLAVLYAISLLL